MNGVCQGFGFGQTDDMRITQHQEEIVVRRFWALDPTHGDLLMLATFDGTAHAFGAIVNDHIRGFADQQAAEAYLAEFDGDGQIVEMVEGPLGGGLPEGWKL